MKKSIYRAIVICGLVTIPLTGCGRFIASVSNSVNNVVQTDEFQKSADDIGQAVLDGASEAADSITKKVDEYNTKRQAEQAAAGNSSASGSSTTSSSESSSAASSTQ